MALSKGTTIIRVKIRGENGWFTDRIFYDWEKALEHYNSSPTPRMLTTKARIHHKQYSDNGFVFDIPDPR